MSAAGRALAVIGLCTVALAQTPALYEEDLLASAPSRVEQWKQMAAYAASLPEKPLTPPKTSVSNRDSLAREFRELLGYPPPGFLDHPTGHFDKVGEDSVAIYYRC